MGTYIARRLLLMIPTLIGITFLVFMLIALSKGGVGAGLRLSGGGGGDASKIAQQRAYLEDRYGLDEPVLVQYLRWLNRVSPIKLGTRDQVKPTGEVISVPRRLRLPPLIDWWGDPAALAAPPAPSTVSVALDAAQRVERYRMTDRSYAERRAASIAATSDLRTALRRYATAAGLDGAVDGDELRERIFRRSEPNSSLPQWSAVLEAGQRAIAAHHDADAARSELVDAFMARPYPGAGLPLVPGLVSLGWPDFGRAFSSGRPVGELIGDRLPITLLLNSLAFPLIYLIAIPSGMLAASRRGSWFDVGSGALLVALWSVPVVLAGTLAIGYLASNVYLGAFPVTGLHDTYADSLAYFPGSGADGAWHRGYLLDTLWHLCLPVACLVYAGFAILSKQTRAAMLDNFNADYVRTAKAKGVPRRDVVFRHVFRNSLLPLITMFVSIFPTMLGGSVIVERIFTIPGMGDLLIRAINDRDREIILANTLMIAAVNLLALLLADILYAMADPRVSYENR